MDRSYATLVISSFAVFAGATARGQELIREHLGPATGGWLGSQVATLADRDGDGVHEYALVDSGAGFHQGTVDVHSGATGALLFTIQGTGTGTFGVAISGIGDMDGDGIADLLVGDPGFDDPNQSYVQEGALRLYSGKDGALINEFFGAGDYNEFGVRAAGLDDIDGDGAPDILVLANDVAGLRNGPLASAISGSDGHVLYTLDMDYVGPVCVGVDRDGDGVRDFLVGSSSCSCSDGGAGPLRAVSGATGTTILQVDNFDLIGTLAEIGDLDGDGLPDVLAGHANGGGGGGSGGFTSGGVTYEVDVFSLGTLSRIRSHVGQFAESIADLDGDGIDDYVISGGSDSFARVTSGRSGDTLYAFASDASGPSGPVQSLGDVNADGLPDFIVGSPSFVDSSGIQRGRARVYAGNDFWLDADPKSANANDTETLTARGVPASHLIGVVLVDVSGTAMFHVLAIAPADATEALVLSGSVPSGLAGVTATFQSFAVGRAGRVVDSARETIEFH